MAIVLLWFITGVAILIDTAPTDMSKKDVLCEELRAADARFYGEGVTSLSTDEICNGE